MANYFSDNLLRILGSTEENRKYKNSINLAVREMGISFGEQLPYHKAIIAEETTYIWQPDFIDRLLYYMSTDELNSLSRLDQDALDNFILFQDGEVLSNDAIYSAFDKNLMDIYNCVDKDTEKVLYDGLVNVSPCN